MEQQLNFLDSLFGKTCQEPSQATKEKTSGQCSKRSGACAEGTFLYLDLRKGSGFLQDASWETAGALPGVHIQQNFGACPSDVRESTLSQILEVNAPEKYYLSPRAAEGILRRAAKRGKELPAMLKEALEEVIALSTSQEKDTGCPGSDV